MLVVLHRGTKRKRRGDGPQEALEDQAVTPTKKKHRTPEGEAAGTAGTDSAKKRKFMPLRSPAKSKPQRSPAKSKHQGSKAKLADRAKDLAKKLRERVFEAYVANKFSLYSLACPPLLLPSSVGDIL